MNIFRNEYSGRFQASQVANYINSNEKGLCLKSLIEQATDKSMHVVTAATVAWRLKALIDAPIQSDNLVLKLRRIPDHEGSWFEVSIDATQP